MPGCYWATMYFDVLCVSVLRSAVLELMGENPFPDHPPKFIRASLYKYHFTSTDRNDETRSDLRNVYSLVIHLQQLIHTVGGGPQKTRQIFSLLQELCQIVIKLLALAAVLMKNVTR